MKYINLDSFLGLFLWALCSLAHAEKLVFEATQVDQFKIQLVKDYKVQIEFMNQELDLELDKGISVLNQQLIDPVEVIKQNFVAFYSKDFKRLLWLATKNRRMYLHSWKSSGKFDPSYEADKKLLAKLTLTLKAKYSFSDDDLIAYRLEMSASTVFKKTIVFVIFLKMEEERWKMDEATFASVEQFLSENGSLEKKHYRIKKVINSLEFK